MTVDSLSTRTRDRDRKLRLGILFWAIVLLAALAVYSFATDPGRAQAGINTVLWKQFCPPSGTVVTVKEFDGGVNVLCELDIDAVAGEKE